MNSSYLMTLIIGVAIGHVITVSTLLMGYRLMMMSGGDDDDFNEKTR